MAESNNDQPLLGAPSVLTPCEEGSDEHLMFCQIMEELESLCQKQFACFQIVGYTSQVVNGTLFQAKIKVADEGETPIVHVKVLRPLPSAPQTQPEISHFKNNQTEAAEFDFQEADMVARALNMIVNEEMKDESSQPGAEGEAAQAEPQGQSISGMVNQSEVSMIMDMGFSKNVAEKACFMVQGAGVERAMEWIENNRSAPDFEEALMIVTQDPNGGGGSGKPSQFAGLSAEEKALKIKELQTMARQKRMKEETANAAENEANRVRMDKELAAAKRIADEQEIVRGLEARKAEKAELAREKARMRDLLERDRRERFGGAACKASDEAKKKSPAEMVEHGIKTVKTLYTDIRAPGVAKTCLKTVQTFIKNAQKDPTNEKFRKVNLDNAAVQTRVAKVNGGVAILKAVGFTQADDGNYLVINNVDDAVLMNAIEQLQPHID